MKRIMLIIVLSAIVVVVFMAFAVSADGKGRQQDDEKTSSGTVLLPIGYKGNETGREDDSRVAEKKENETKGLKERENKTDWGVDKEKTMGKEINETKKLKEMENKTKKEVNETEGIEHGKEGFPPGLNQSITKGRPSNVSIEVRIRNIERIREKFQEIRPINVTEKHGLRIGQYVQNLEDISMLMGNESIGMKVSEIAKNINKSLEKGKKAEERIKGRGFIIRFIFGGDKNSAREMGDEISNNQRMIKELKDIENESEGDVKPLLREHIRLLEEENARLDSISKAEFKVFSLFGWLF